MPQGKLVAEPDLDPGSPDLYSGPSSQHHFYAFQDYSLPQRAGQGSGSHSAQTSGHHILNSVLYQLSPFIRSHPFSPAPLQTCRVPCPLIPQTCSLEVF